MNEQEQMLAAVERKMFGASQLEPFRLARFAVLGRLGSGSAGLVFRAYDPELDRAVAIKILRPGDGRRLNSLRARDRFVREARSVAKFDHPNVISIYDVGTFDLADIAAHLDPRPGQALSGEGIFIVMELVEGQNLGAWILEEGRTWRDVVRVFVEAGRGLAAAHDAGIVHRDFKPENVLLRRREDGTVDVKVADFGLAVSLSDGRPSVSEDAPSIDEGPDGSTDENQQTTSPRVDRLTQTGMVLGTPVYMAPEQHRGEEPRAASDQYAFCTALYLALFGRLPYEGSNWTELYEAKMRAPLRFPDAAVPRWLKRVLERGLAADPSRRFPDMRKLLVALDTDRVRTLRRWGGAIALPLGLAGIAWGTSLALQPGTVELAVTASGQPLTEFVVDIDARRHELDAAGRVQLSPGRHIIEVTAPDHERAVELVEIDRGETHRLSIDLVHETGRIDLEVQPRGGMVLIDGVDRGSRLVDFPVDTGRHEVVVRYLGHYDERFEIEVAADQRIEKFVALREAVAWTQPRSGVTGALSFVGDVDGDGFGDVMHRHFRTLSLYDPWAAQQLWSETLPEASRVWAADVDRDGNVEIVIAISSEDGTLLEVRDAALVAGKPKPRWTRTLRSEALDTSSVIGVAIEDLDGDGALDLLAAPTNPPRIVGLRGHDGAALFDRALDDEPLAFTAADGPNGRRVYVLGPRALHAFDAANASPAWEVPIRTASRVHSGDASELERVGLDGSGFRSHVLTAVTRTDGKPPDVAVLGVTASGEPHLEVRAAEGGDLRWTTTGANLPWMRRALDVDGDRIADLLLHVPSGGGHYELRSGASGTRLWSGAERQAARVLQWGDDAVLVTFDEDTLQVLQHRNGAVETIARRQLALAEVHRTFDWNGDGREELVVSGGDDTMQFLARDLSLVASVPLQIRPLRVADPVDADRDGALDLLLEARGPTVLRGSKVRWSREFTDAVRGAPAPFDADGDGALELAVTGDVEGRQGFFVLRAATGEFVVGPRENAGGNAIRGPVPLQRRDGGTDFVFQIDRWLVRHRGDTGEMVGRVAIPLAYARPAVHDIDGDGALEAITVDWAEPGNIYVVDADTMQTERMLPLPGGGWGQPNIADFTGDGVLDLAATRHDGTVMLYDTAEWNEHWSTSTGARLAFGVTPVQRSGSAADIVVAPSDESGVVLYLSGKTGEVLWRREHRGSGRSRPLARDVDGDGEPEIFAAGLRGVVSRLTTAGDVQWSTDVTAVDGTRPNPSGPPALSDLDRDGTFELMTGWEDGTMRVFDASDGTLEWVFHTDGEIEAPPVAVDVDGDGVEEVVVASHDRQLYCVEHRAASSKRN